MNKQDKVEIALFRYSLIRPLLDEGLPRAEVSARLDSVVFSSHRDPRGNFIKISRRTCQRWIEAYRRGGFDGLHPKERCDLGSVRATDIEILDLAEKLKRENPKRSSSTIAGIIARHKETLVSERTIRRHLAKRGATFPELAGGARRAYVRFERDKPNELWLGDLLWSLPAGPKRCDQKATRLSVLLHRRSQPAHCPRRVLL